MELSSIFGRFAGREVPMIERIEEGNVGGKHYRIPVVELANKNDPTLAEMKQVAKQNGLSLRVWWPGVAGTMDFRTDRVNINIEKGGDGKWRVANSFGIG